MDVVTRALMAAGMAVFAAMHALQVIDPPAEAPMWLTIGFAAVAIAGAALAALIIIGPESMVARAQVAAALLAGGSAVALVLALTIGIFGVVEPVLRYAVVMSFVAEAVVLGAFAAARLAPDATDGRTDAPITSPAATS